MRIVKTYITSCDVVTFYTKESWSAANIVKTSCLFLKLWTKIGVQIRGKHPVFFTKEITVTLVSCTKTVFCSLLYLFSKCMHIFLWHVVFQCKRKSLFCQYLSISPYNFNLCTWTLLSFPWPTKVINSDTPVNFN